jgi:peptidoglycan/LPS O-acetylase OafA/YrhL
VFDHIFALGVVLISAAFSFFVYVETGQNSESIYWSVYAFGAFFLPGIYTAYPGFKKQRDHRGFEVKVPRGRNLSRVQAITIFSWIVGLGLVIVYVTQF